jgi:AraC-like DNA-binding protein
MMYTELVTKDIDEWEALSDSFLPSESRYRDPRNWWIRATVQDTVAHTLLRFDQRSERLAWRTPSHTRQGGKDYWLVVPQRAVGGVNTFEMNDTVMRVTPGSAMLLSPDQPFRYYMPRMVTNAVRIPRADIDNRLSSARPPQTTLDMESGLGRIVQSMIRETHAERSNLTDWQFNAVCDRITELICLMLLGDMGPQRSHLAETAAAVRQYVREHVGVGDLRLPVVASALGWSPRQLRLALQQSGTTYREVRQDEALRAARDLLSQQGMSTTVSDVAARCGFTQTWFSQAFKARYGETPRDFQRRRSRELTDRLVSGLDGSHTAAFETHHAAGVPTATGRRCATMPPPVCSPTWSDRVGTALEGALTEGTPSLADAARLLEVGPRTLQRRLADEGTTWSRELNQARRRHLDNTTR